MVYPNLGLPKLRAVCPRQSGADAETLPARVNPNCGEARVRGRPRSNWFAGVLSRKTGDQVRFKLLTAMESPDSLPSTFTVMLSFFEPPSSAFTAI